MAVGDGLEAPDVSVDARLPRDIALKAEQAGVDKAGMDAPRLFVLAVLAGAFIGLGAMFATTIMAGSEGVLPFGVARLLGGLAFSLGLVLVIVGGAELFTGDNLMVMAFAAGKIRLGAVLRVWAIVYAGNFLGALGTAALVYLSGQYLSGDGDVARAALALAVNKTALPFGQALVLGVLCNVLVCLAVWLSLGARGVAGKILAIAFPISAFVAAGFEHSVANMYIIPLGLMIKAGAPAALWSQLAMAPSALSGLTWTGFAASLVPVTIGNIIGGAGLVGAVYWFVYLRPERRP